MKREKSTNRKKELEKNKVRSAKKKKTRKGITSNFSTAINRKHFYSKIFSLRFFI